MTIQARQQPARTGATARGSGLAVWERVVSELARLQDAAPPASPGAVVNPILGGPYVVDTCCAAAAFAAEHGRTGDGRWQTRADDALRAARSFRLFRGVGEPTWDGDSGWRDVAQSLPATGMAVDAYCDALDRLGRAIDEGDVHDLLDFLLACRREEGGFAHNALTTGHGTAEVQNATASALNLLGRLGRGTATDTHPLLAELDTARQRLEWGQRRSGYWPYSYPGAKLRLKEAAARRPFRALLGPTRLVPYGDVAHHLMTLTFAAGYASAAGAATETAMLASGWRWIEQRLRPSADGGLAIDWADDVAPRFPQISNARDTNAYFLILGALPRLASLGIVGEQESNTIADALLAHVEASLLSEPGRTPCVVPHEATPEVAANLVPMFEQSVAWKGSLMAGVIVRKESRRGA